MQENLNEKTATVLAGNESNSQLEEMAEFLHQQVCIQNVVYIGEAMDLQIDQTKTEKLLVYSCNLGVFLVE